MKKYDTVVVGAGLGGLSAALAMAKLKKKVLVLEQHYIVGGCATNFYRADDKKNRYRFEVALHQVAGLDGSGTVGIILKEHGLLDKITAVRQKKKYVSDKYSVDANNLEELVEGLVKLFPKEEDGIRSLYEDMYGLLTTIDRTFNEDVNPNNLTDLHDITALQLTSRYVKDKDLIRLILSNFVYYSDDYEKLNAFYYFYPEMEYIVHGGWYVKGGSQVLSNVIAEEIKRLGGEIKLRHEVVGVHLTNNKKQIDHIVASDLADGKETAFKAKNYAFNTSPIQLYSLANMVDEHSDELKRPHLTSFRGAYIGINVPPAKLKIIEQEYHYIFKNSGWILSNYNAKDTDLKNSKVGCLSMITISRADEWPERETKAYETKKQKMFKEIIDLLESKFKGIKKHITIMEACTPKTIQKWTMNENGAMYGVEMWAGLEHRKAETKLKNAFITGVWGDTGGGFEGAMISGSLTGKRIADNGYTKKIVDFTYNKWWTLLAIALCSISLQMWGTFMFTAFKSIDDFKLRTLYAYGSCMGIWVISYFTYRFLTKFNEKWKLNLLELTVFILINFLFIYSYTQEELHFIRDGEGSLLYFGAILTYALVWFVSSITKPITAMYSKWQVRATVTGRNAFVIINKNISRVWTLIFIVAALGNLFIPQPFTPIINSMVMFGPIYMVRYYKKMEQPIKYRGSEANVEVKK